MESDLKNAERLRAASIQPMPLGMGGTVAGVGPRNYSDELVAEKQYYADECAGREPLRVRVERRLAEMTVDTEKIMRLKSILEQHPEFETFIEFQQLLNRTRLR